MRAWADSAPDASLYLSVLTVGEIRKGIDRLRPRDPMQAEVFERWITDLQNLFQDRLLAIDAAVAEEWGRLNAIADRPTIDSLIAATARVHRLTVVTRNTSDFEGCGVVLVNPWIPPGGDLLSRAR